MARFSVVDWIRPLVELLCRRLGCQLVNGVLVSNSSSGTRHCIAYMSPRLSPVGTQSLLRMSPATLQMPQETSKQCWSERTAVTEVPLSLWCS